MPLINTQTVIDKTPITYRGYCHTCEKVRLLHSKLVTVKSNDVNVCKVTCLTCQNSVTQ